MIPGQPQSPNGSPFTASYSAELYWEGRRVRGLADRALDALKRGRSVWVKGANGSGRQSFIRHLAGKAAALARPVAVIDTTLPADGEAFIENLVRRLSDKPVPSTHIEKCESLYAALLDGLWRGGAVLCMTEPDPLLGDALKEAEILIGLKILEQPLVSFVGCGEGVSPLGDMTTLELSAYNDDELVRMVNHRLVMTSNAGLIDPEQVAQIAAAAKGPADLMERGDIALGRLLYKSAGEGSASAGENPLNTEQSQPRDIFSPEEVARVSKLLKEI